MSVRSDELLEAVADHERSAARLAAMVAEFDAEQLWDDDAATSMVAWLRDRARMLPGDAQRLVTLGKKTRVLPATHDGWVSGALSTGQVQTILKRIGKKIALFEEHEADLVPTLVPLSIIDTDTVMRDWRAKADAADGGETPEESEPASRVHLSPVGERHALNGDLNAEDGAIVATALRVARPATRKARHARRASVALTRWRTCAASSWTTRPSAVAAGTGRT